MIIYCCWLPSSLITASCPNPVFVFARSTINTNDYKPYLITDSLLLVLIHETHRLYQEPLSLLSFAHSHEVLVEFFEVLADVARIMVRVGGRHVHP